MPRNCWRKNAACWFLLPTAAAIAREVIALLTDDTRRHSIRKNAYRLGREMVWSNVAQLYMRTFELSRLQGAARSRKSLATKNARSEDPANCRN